MTLSPIWSDDQQLVQRHIHKIQMSLHYLFGFASIFPKRAERSVWIDALANHGFRARDLTNNMADQFSDLQQEAVEADMKEYFDAFCLNTMEGEVMRMCKDLLVRPNRTFSDVWKS